MNHPSKCLARHVLHTVLGLLFLASTAASGQQTAPPLPPVDISKTVTEAVKSIDIAVASRVGNVEDSIADLEKRLAAAKRADERIAILEQRVQLAESRAALERTRALGRVRPKYTNGFKLLTDIQSKSQGLVAAGYSVNALSAVSDLTDLRKYSGFKGAFDKLVGKVGDNTERSWLVGLVEEAIPKVTPALNTLAAFTPLAGAAGFALTQLRTILPAFAKDKLKGTDLKNTYTSLMCGLDAVGKLHDDLARLEQQNAKWTQDIIALQQSYPKELERYRSLVGSAPTVSDAQFYAAVEQRFNEQVTAPEYLSFVENVDQHVHAFETTARSYHLAASQHLEYWEGLKKAVMVRRDMECMQNDAGTKARFDNTIAQIDNAVNTLRTAYMFTDVSKPEYEYYRIVTANIH
jgi:hypothetical protein